MAEAAPHQIGDGMAARCSWNGEQKLAEPCRGRGHRKLHREVDRSTRIGQRSPLRLHRLVPCIPFCGKGGHGSGHAPWRKATACSARPGRPGRYSGFKPSNALEYRGRAPDEACRFRQILFLGIRRDSTIAFSVKWLEVRNGQPRTQDIQKWNEYPETEVTCATHSGSWLG